MAGEKLCFQTLGDMGAMADEKLVFQIWVGRGVWADGW